ncbi:hypothetical protein NHN08_04725 [Riemerella anatipestifer]|uniref:DUF6759 domain-containing protein n=1 Tax=Riemerella anatipestifer TaxID=34085 RepID=UPI002096C147|nr:DUF6759 domain-containing protein [Riemerella anatipestifer]MCO7331802.1 hypothetical protein [Riemerella anatipestifer]MCO7350689.1 hypothetical protein [Riemerella anatipestifer]
MKKVKKIAEITLCILAFSTSFIANAQSRYTPQQVEASNDIKVIANFIKYNPEHPDTPKFKTKLHNILNGETKEKELRTKKMVSVPTKTEAINTNIVMKPTNVGNNSKPVDVLNHLFSNDPTKKEAYLLVKNLSNCNITLKIDGNKKYNLDVAAHNENYILLDKGNYSLSASICNGKYLSNKLINKDMEVSLSLN